VAPLEASSAGRGRHRLNRGGNRRLNAILHRIAIAQARSSPAARTYLARRESDGKTRREALRALKRFLVGAIWRVQRSGDALVSAQHLVVDGQRAIPGLDCLVGDVLGGVRVSAAEATLSARSSL
jgi:transposase